MRIPQPIYRLIPAVTICLLLLCAIACKPKAIREGATELRIAVELQPAFGPILLAKQKQWLEATLLSKGVKLRWTTFKSGAAGTGTRILTQNDVVFVGDAPAIRARAAGVDIVTVGIAATGPGTLAVVARADAAIKTAAELKGKKVGVTFGTSAHHLLALVIQKAGLNLDDLKLVDLAPDDLVEAYRSGLVVAAAVSGRQLSALSGSNTVRVSLGTENKLGLSVIAASDSYAQANNDLIEAVLRTYRQGAEFIKSHPKEAAVSIAKELTLPPTQVQESLTQYSFQTTTDSLHIADLKATEEFLRSANVYRVNVDAFTDSRYLYRVARK